MHSILFILPVGGGGGGAHSVMQEADLMRAMGLDARIATNTPNAPRLRQAYNDLRTIQENVLAYGSPAELGALIAEVAPDMVVATTNQSVHALAAGLASAGRTDQRSAYYIQDYEPLFYPPDSDEWHLAYRSFALIPNIVCFAKTDWLCHIVEANHQVQVAKVQPSIDHRVFFPALDRLLEMKGPVSVAAMIRPTTSRRAPRRTRRLLDAIAAEFGDRIACMSFGCTDEDLAAHGLASDTVTNLGVLERAAVGELFRRTDLFLDLSDYQAFGRGAVEAMSCGCPAVVPAHGGAHEFARDGRNGFVVDTRSDAAIMEAVRSFMERTLGGRRAMALHAVETGYRYSVARAAISEIAVLFGDGR